MTPADPPRILAWATKGTGTNEEHRLRNLLSDIDCDFFAFDRTHKIVSFRRLRREIRQAAPELLVMEGTGVAGGLACLWARLLRGTPYVVSSGDAVGPWVSTRLPLIGLLFGAYERLLCRSAAGYIGWSPYLVGRALSFGVPRAMTAPGWAPFQRTDEQLASSRAQVREYLGIPEHAIVFGIVGSLVWSSRARYCYGLELVSAMKQTDRDDVRALIVGEGSGLAHLQEVAGNDRRVILAGAVPWDQVIDHLAAMDVGSLPQSVDRVGSFRYTTKISEYAAARLPIVTGQIPLSYDLPHDWIWRLPGAAPWDRRYIDALSQLMTTVTPQQIAEKRCQVPRSMTEFDRDTQVRRATEFVQDVLDASRAHRARGRGSRATRPPWRHDVRARRRLLSIAHSYVVAMNRRLAHEMQLAAGDAWEVTAVAPSYFAGKDDLRPLSFEPVRDEPVRVEVVPTHLTRQVHVFNYGRRLKAILREGWDAVHAWEEPYIYAGYQIGRWTPDEARLVYRTAQSLDKRYPPPFNWIERRNMSRADGWTCSGTLVAQVLGARPIYRAKPMRLIPLAVDLSAFRPDRAAGEQVLRDLNWPVDGPPVVGFLGRFTEAKGVQMLMRVLAQLTTPWRAMFVGGGPLEGELHYWARTTGGGGDRVRVLNNVRHGDVPAHLNAMDMLVAPSQTTKNWREQFGRMLIEAFASGVPVIGSDSGEIPFVIGDAGVVVPERDESAWRAAIESLLESPDRRRELAERGLARAPQYASSSIARRYLDFFDELLAIR